MRKTVCFKGKSKIFYKTEKDEILLMKFLDFVHGGGREEKISGTGKIRADICEILFKHLEKNKIKTHYLNRVSETEFKVKKLKMFKLEIIPRNFAAGTLVKYYPYSLGDKLDPPLVNFYLKSDKDPLLTHELLLSLRLVSAAEFKQLISLARKTNAILSSLLKLKKILLADFKFEAGCDSQGTILIGDEISCDCARMWDLDKDVFRYQKGDLMKTYKQLLTKFLS